MDFEIFLPILAEKSFKETFKIRGFELLLKALIHFGSAIQRLTIQFDHIYNTTAAAICISQYVNQYTGRSLTHLKLNEMKTNTLEQFAIPFEAVDSLHLGIEIPVNGHATLTLNEIFPNLRSLNLTLRSKVDISLIVCEFPRLVNLKLYMSECGTERNDQIFRLMAKNPHIKCIEVEFYPRTLVRFDLERMNQLLPKLELLTLHSFDIGNESVHFEHLKGLHWERKTSDSIELLSFSRLESLEMNEYHQEEIHAWAHFFCKNKNLNRLHVTIVDLLQTCRI